MLEAETKLRDLIEGKIKHKILINQNHIIVIETYWERPPSVSHGAGWQLGFSLSNSEREESSAPEWTSSSVFISDAGRKGSCPWAKVDY